MRPSEDYNTWKDILARLSLVLYVLAALTSFALMAASLWDDEYAKATFWLILCIVNSHLAKATIEDWA